MYTGFPTKIFLCATMICLGKVLPFYSSMGLDAQGLLIIRKLQHKLRLQTGGGF